MSKPEPIYETAWLTEWEDYWCGDRFAYREASDLYLCSSEIHNRFLIGSAKSIKVALFTEKCDESVQIKIRSVFGFLVDGDSMIFGIQAYGLILRMMKKHKTETLYAKCYVEA